MEEIRENIDTTGNVKISEEVIITIASVAVSEIEGISGTGTGIVEGLARKFVKRPAGGGIKVSMSDTDVTIDINVIMNYGVRIPEVAWNVQDAVKKQVELMTGLNVTKVNVRVVGIEIPADETAPEIAENTDGTEDSNE